MKPEIGLEKGIVRLVPHHPEWKDLFEAEKERILLIVKDIPNCEVIRDVQHIGSTAIPGIVAKPIIDIGVAVTSFQAGYALVKPLEELGYVYKGENGVPNRHYFDYGNPCTVHLHLFAQSSVEWQVHILFRDYLIRHPETAVQYDQLKFELAEKYCTDREKYTDGKGAFIQNVVSLARAEQAKPDDK